MSGRLAPARTATAIEDSANAVRLPALRNPSASSFFVASSASTTMSNFSPARTRLAASTPPTASIATDLPAFCWYAPESSARSWRVAIDDMPTISAAMFSSVDIFQPGLRERLTHLVHVEPEHAACQLFALVGFVGLARFRRIGRLLRNARWHDDDAIHVGHDDIAGIDRRTGANHRDVHRTQRRLHGAAGADGAGKHREFHLGQVHHVADAAIDDQALGAAGAKTGGEQIAEEA